VDEIIVFHSLGLAEIDKIVDILLAEVQERVSSYGLSLQMSPEARELLVEKGYDPALGARPLRRTIQRMLEDPLAEEVLRGTFRPGSSIKVCRKKDILSFECKPRPKKEKVGCAKGKENEIDEKELD
jgi:ATP-dependent Clp protease ATP-binding subunit ClpC